MTKGTKRGSGYKTKKFQWLLIEIDCVRIYIDLNWRYVWCLKVRDIYIKTEGFFIYTSLHLPVLLKILFSVILNYISQKGSITQNRFSLMITLNIYNSVKHKSQKSCPYLKTERKSGEGKKAFCLSNVFLFLRFYFFSGLSVVFSQIIVNFDAWFPDFQRPILLSWRGEAALLWSDLLKSNLG